MHEVMLIFIREGEERLLIIFFMTNYYKFILDMI